jgi:hypothetical protein
MCGGACVAMNCEFSVLGRIPPGIQGFFRVKLENHCAAIFVCSFKNCWRIVIREEPAAV